MKKTFNEQCYELLKTIPKGKVTTYKEIANALGTKAYRAVGNAMNKNPNIITTPCFKVIKSNGEVGEYAYIGKKEKIKRLKKEGIKIINGKINLKKYLHKF